MSDNQHPLTLEEGYEKYGYDLGIQAYQWFFGRWRMILEERDTLEKNKVPVNQLLKYTQLPTAKDRIYVAPNLDCLNTVAYFDLSVEPQILTMPPVDGDRFYTLMLLDAWHHIVDNLSKKNYGTNGGNFALVGPDWHGVLPDDVVEVRSLTNTVAMLGHIRVTAEDPADYQQAQAIQAKLKVQGLNQYLGNPAPEEPLQATSANLIDPDARGTLKIFDNFEDILHRNPPYGADAAAAERFREIIPAPGKKLHPATIRGFERAAQEAHLMIDWKAKSWGKVLQGEWVGTSTKFSTPAWSWLERAGLCEYGILANVKEENMYFSGMQDEVGNSLTGGKTYLVTLDPLPPVTEFWSAILYGFPGNFLIDNLQNKYRIGDNSKGLHYEANGGVKIYIAPECPDGVPKANWIPSTADVDQQLLVLIRVYGSTPALFTYQWAPQPIEVLS